MNQQWIPGFLPADKPLDWREAAMFEALCERHYGVSRETQAAYRFLIDEMLMEAIEYAG